MKDLLKCSKEKWWFDNTCGTKTIIDPVNWWILIGAFVSPFIILGFYKDFDYDVSTLLSVVIYGVVTIIIVQVIVTFVGFNMYFFNHIFETTQSRYMLLSFMFWSALITVLSEMYLINEGYTFNKNTIRNSRLLYRRNYGN